MERLKCILVTEASTGYNKDIYRHFLGGGISQLKGFCRWNFKQMMGAVVKNATIVPLTGIEPAALRFRCRSLSRVKIDKINNLFQVDINRREEGCAAHYEQHCQHVVTALFNCNNLEQHG